MFNQKCPCSAGKFGGGQAKGAPAGRIAINPQAICGLRNSLRKFG
jgi:hypothetical protein